MSQLCMAGCASGPEPWARLRRRRGKAAGSAFVGTLV